MFFWALGRHLGVTGAQDNSGELLGHVRDTGADPRTERQYKTNANIVLHCDAADVVGLLAVRTARVGGVSRLVSSVTVFNEMVRTPSGPAHLARLFQDVPLDTRGSGGINCLHLPPLRFDGAVLRTFWHQEYFRTVARHAGCGPLDPVLVAALDAYDQVADRPDLALNMELQRGDVQLVSNHFVLHARTGFEDWEDPALKCVWGWGSGVVGGGGQNACAFVGGYVCVGLCWGLSTCQLGLERNIVPQCCCP